MEPLTRTGRFVLRSTVATPPRVYVVVTAALALLFSLTAVVTARFHAERHELAHEHHVSGRNLARAGRYDESVSRLRASLALDRDNTATQLALATTLLDAGRPQEAGAYLVDVLRKDPTSGQANLVRARIARTMAVPDDAERHYLRAIYGEWPLESRGGRLDARFELVGFLLGRGERQRALGELAAIKSDSRDDLDVARRLATMFLQAGAPDMAATELRAITAKTPDDAAAWSLLSEADLALGRYAATVLDAERAVQLDPESPAAARLQLASEVLGLDPTARRLRSAERERRARQLLDRNVRLIDGCLGSAAQGESALADARVRALARLDSPAGRSSDAADAAIDDVEVLWRLTIAACPDAPRRDPVLAGVLSQVLDREAR